MLLSVSKEVRGFDERPKVNRSRVEADRRSLAEDGVAVNADPW